MFLVKAQRKPFPDEDTCRVVKATSKHVSKSQWKLCLTDIVSFSTLPASFKVDKKVMVSTLLRCFVTLTVAAVLILGETAKVAARASTATAFQGDGLDTLPSTAQLHSRQQWPARLLKSLAAIPFIKSLTHTSVGKRVSPQLFLKHADDQEAAVTDLFKLYKVGDVDGNRFFKSKRFVKWEGKVRKAYKADSEKLMFRAMDKELQSRSGGVEAIIAQAVKDPDTRDLGLRFEDLLLQRMVVSNKFDKLNDIWSYMRYPHYRDPDQRDVHLKMGQLLGDSHFLSRIESAENEFKMHSVGAIGYLEDVFKLMSGGKEVVAVFKELPKKGFNHNAFLMKLFYDKMSNRAAEPTFTDFMLKRLRRSRWADDDITKFLQQLKKQKNLSDLNPMIEAMLSALKTV